MPVDVAAIPWSILVVAQLAGDAFGKAAAAETPVVQSIWMKSITSSSKKSRNPAHLALLWLVYYRAVGIWLLGIVIALPLLVLLYTLIEGKSPGQLPWS